MEWTDWLNTSIGTMLGLVTGVASGFYFEKRQTRAAKAERDELRHDNAALQERIGVLQDRITKLNVNLTTTQSTSQVPIVGPGGDDLETAVMKYVAARLDASGGLPRARVVEHFGRTYGAAGVDQALAALQERGRIAVTADMKVRITR